VLRPPVRFLEGAPKLLDHDGMFFAVGIVDFDGPLREVQDSKDPMPVLNVHRAVDDAGARRPERIALCLWDLRRKSAL